MNTRLLTPPEYCPDALATDVGWINPKNGEILVIVKDLRNRLTLQAAELAKALATMEAVPELEPTTVDDVEVVNQPETSSSDAVETTNKPGRRGRPRKMTSKETI